MTIAQVYKIDTRPEKIPESEKPLLHFLRENGGKVANLDFKFQFVDTRSKCGWSFEENRYTAFPSARVRRGVACYALTADSRRAREKPSRLLGVARYAPRTLALENAIAPEK